MLETLELSDGEAEYMGDGMFVLVGKDERGEAQNYVVSTDDIRKLSTAMDAVGG